MNRRMVVVGVIILLLVGVNVSGGFAKETKEVSTLGFDGTTYFVDDDFDESTPGWNVTCFNKIRNAIDVTVEGDTVYVYSGFYDEVEKTINTTINLIGEDKNYTIVGRDKNTHIFKLEKNDIKISGFTFKNCSKGLQISSSRNIIYDNIFLNNDLNGISIDWWDNNHIYNNIFINNGFKEVDYSFSAINCYYSDGNVIENNTFEFNTFSISLEGSDNNIISNNIIKKSKICGIYVGGFHRGCNNTSIYSNHIVYNIVGVCLDHSFFTTVSRNNIYRNVKNGVFYNVILGEFLNKWSENYWGTFVLRPKIIFGFADVPISYDFFNGFTFFPFPSIRFDLKPVRIPYDMEGI